VGKSLFFKRNHIFAMMNQIITAMDTLVTLHDKVEALPLNLRKEVMLFIDFLIEKSGKNAQKTQRTFGSAKGKIHISEDFDEPLEDFKEYM
jgi:hypothetical protein